MISRLTAYAACFAVLSAFMITFGASAASRPLAALPTGAPSLAVKIPVVVQLPPVQVVGRRAAATGG